MKKLIAFILVVCLMMTTSLPAFAADPEEYLSDLRIVYASSYDEAKEIIAESAFSDYEVYKQNLNKDTGKIGVWLAYNTTEDVDDAITDIAVIPMNGGYREGNYQEMVRQSYEQYMELGEIYAEAIEYFADAYEAGDFLAECAYRQLNLYCDNDDHDGELLGDLFLDGVDPAELATMFLEGNSYVLRNVRSLIAQGVSYNDSGDTYLELVAEAAAEMTEDETVFDDEDYYDLALLISGAIITFGDMFEELATVEDELDYTDEEFTQEEILYAEYMNMALMLREVQYLGDQTLYDFCLDFELDEEDLSELYPLVAALNDGQIAMTKVSHYYDVVRYSTNGQPEDLMDEEITKLEEKYGDDPFDIYTGVDRSVYTGSFALTNDAYRADASTESGLGDALFNKDTVLRRITDIGAGAIGLPLFVYGIIKAVGGNGSVAASGAAGAMSAAEIEGLNAANSLATVNAKLYFGAGYDPGFAYDTFDDIANGLLNKYLSAGDASNLLGQSFYNKVQYIHENINLTGSDYSIFSQINNVTAEAKSQVTMYSSQQASEATTQTVVTTHAASGFMTGLVFLASGVLMLYSAISLGLSVYNYKHPDYDDIPVAMVDMIETEDGDRYIKYDAVLEAECGDNGEYTPGDLNAFNAQRWNALYVTKSYEAGKPLLADFNLSNSNHVAKDNYLPVHKFGEEICYNLNKYNFDNDSDTIYLSVKQSENQKSAVADVPEVVGSLITSGYLFVAAGVGAVVGIGGTMGTGALLKKKK